MLSNPKKNNQKVGTYGFTIKEDGRMELGVVVLIVALSSFAIGLATGLTTKGVNIHIIHKKDVDKPKEYNQSLAPLLPQQVQEYYKSTNGQNKF